MSNLNYRSYSVYERNPEHMYNNCIIRPLIEYGLANESVTIGNNVTNCAYMFANCDNFNQQVTIPDNVTDCTFMFRSCSKFNQPITIPSSVTSCENMFRNCPNMSSNIYINNKVGIDVSYMLRSYNTQKRINVFCNNIATLNKTASGESLTGTDITWTSTTNGYYNATYNIYIYNNYGG